MRRRYFAHYYKNFGNTYSLMYADTEEDLKLIPEDAEQITRKEAEALASAENYRRKRDQSCSGFADNAIYPVGMTQEEMLDLPNSRKYYKEKYIWERV